MKRNLQKSRMDHLITYLIVIGIIFLLNIVCLRFFVKLDLTREQVFSLSNPSKAMIKKLSEPMTVKVFFTPDLPAPYNSYERYLKDILAEYKLNSRNNNFRYEFVDMSRNPDEPSEYGISPVQIRVVDKDQFQSKKAFVGMVFLHANMVERIQQITTVDGLEYRITSIIRKMINKIDWLSALKTNIQVVLIASSDIPLQEIPHLNDTIKEKFDSLNSKMMGKLEYRYYDPVRDKEGEELAKKYGFQKISWKSIADEQGNSIPSGSGYVGLLIKYEDKYKIINLLSEGLLGNYYLENLDSLEDTMQGAVDNLIRVNPKVGYLYGDGEPEPWDYGRVTGQDSGDAVSRFADFINQDYEFETVSLKDGKIPDDLSALLIVEPRLPMTEYEFYQIDQFIMSGKPVAFFTPGLFYPQPDAQSTGEVPKGYKSLAGIDKLLEYYGIRINDNLILDKVSYKQQMSQDMGGGELAIHFAPIIEQENISKNNIITKKIKGMLVVKASSLDPVEDTIKSNNLIFTPLIKTSKESWEAGPGVSLHPYFLQPSIDTKYSQYTLAATLEGRFKSYFEGKEIPSAPPSTNNTKLKIKSNVLREKTADFLPVSDHGRIIVLSVAEMLKNTIMDEEGISPNAIFSRNVVDWLVGDSDLIQIRNKGLSYNPPRKTSDLVKNIVRWSDLIIAPLLVVLLGFLLWNLDSARRKKIKALFNK